MILTLQTIIIHHLEFISESMPMAHKILKQVQDDSHFSELSHENGDLQPLKTLKSFKFKFYNLLNLFNSLKLN